MGVLRENVGGLLLLAAIGLCAGQSRLAEAGPNVIVVMTDDQGYGEFSCHGNPLVETPHVDRLASESVRLTDFHVAPMCTPTRGQLLTGLDAFRNGAINVSSGRALLRPELATIADVFRAGGYRTGHFGKWHLGDNYPYRPHDRGFDEAIWFPSSHVNSVPDFWENDYFGDTYLHRDKRRGYKGYCTDVFFDEAMQWMASESQRNQPFFAYIALNAAHWPWFVPEEYRDVVREQMAKHPEVVASLSPQKRKDLVSFLAMGVSIDTNIGRLDTFLRERNWLNDTIVVFLTDNGSTMGPAYYNAGMRGGKTTLWEGGHRVPCFLRWPEGLKPREVDSLTHVQDLLPTLAALAGVGDHLSEPLDGVSLEPALRGQLHALDERMLVINYSRMPQFKVSYTNRNPAIPMREGAGVLWKRWRFLEDRMLFDVERDPAQQHDVAAEHPQVVAKMRAHLDHWWAGVEGKVLAPQRVIVGHPAENPTHLTACEWLDVFVDQQVQVRRGVLENGVWHLEVAKAGEYRFELRRWPRESGLRVDEACPQTTVVDGVYQAGVALPIASASLRVGAETVPAERDRDGTAFQATCRLKQGPSEFQATFHDADGKPVCGAYYLTVERL